MSARKLERLVNLTMLLLSTRRFLTVEQIHELIPAYDQPDPEAFRRMFERDKEELRELGIPLETGSESVWEDEPGYRIRRTEYQLPIIDLDPEEGAALGLAARLWHSAGLADASRSALLKLRAAGIEAEPVSGAVIEPRVDAPDAAFGPMLAAVRAGTPVGFDYRRSGGKAPVRRTLEPWSVVHRRGRWYVVGFDRDRSAPRAFRLSRVVGDVSVAAGAVTPPPDDLDPLAMVGSMDDESMSGVAMLRLANGAAWNLRRAASSEQPDELDGWTSCKLAYGDTERFAAYLVGFGPDVQVCEPADLKEAVVRRLRALVGELT
ncbi:MAG: WYL domain-containing protein [Actinomycetota bacterium]